MYNHFYSRIHTSKITDNHFSAKHLKYTIQNGNTSFYTKETKNIKFNKNINKNRKRYIFKSIVSY